MIAMVGLFVLRRMWIVGILAFVFCAAFAMDAIAALQAPAEPDHAVVPRPQAPPPAKLVTPAKRDGEAFVARNMFCSTCDPVGPMAAPGETFTPPAILIATNVGATDSRATVRVTTTEAQGNWGLGEVIPAVGTITRIGYASIDVTDEAGRIAKLSLLSEAPKSVPAATAGAATPAVANPYAERVRKLDDGTYDVDRNIVKELVAMASNPSKAGARAVPIVTDGKFTGIRLLSVKADSAPAAVGMKSGDILEAIDGEPIRTAQQLIDLYAKIDKVDSVELQGKRGGKPHAVRLNLK